MVVVADVVAEVLVVKIDVADVEVVAVVVVVIVDVAEVVADVEVVAVVVVVIVDVAEVVGIILSYNTVSWLVLGVVQPGPELYSERVVL